MQGNITNGTCQHVLESLSWAWPSDLKVNGVLLSMWRSGGITASQHSSPVVQQRQGSELGKVGLNPQWNFFPADFILGNCFNSSYTSRPCQVRHLVVSPRSVDKKLSGSSGNRVFLAQVVLWVLLRSWLALGEDLSPQMWDSHSQSRRKWLQS